MKIYTVAANFSIEDYKDFDQLWVAQFKNKKDAVKAFHFKLDEAGVLDKSDKKVTVESGDKKEYWTVEQLFDDMIKYGYRFTTGEGSEGTHWYVRGEELMESFDKNKIAWN